MCGDDDPNDTAIIHHATVSYDIHRSTAGRLSDLVPRFADEVVHHADPIIIAQGGKEVGDF